MTISEIVVISLCFLVIHVNMAFLVWFYIIVLVWFLTQLIACECQESVTRGEPAWTQSALGLPVVCCFLILCRKDFFFFNFIT